MRLLLRLIKSKKANKNPPSHGESVHDRGISFCVNKLEVGGGQKHRFGAVSEPVQNERNKIKILLRLRQRYAIIEAYKAECRFSGPGACLEVLL